MGANIAGIYGAQIFRQDDRPRYRRGFAINIAVLAVGLAMAILRFVDDLKRRRRTAKQVQTEPASGDVWQDEEKLPTALASDVQPQMVLIESNLKPAVLDPVK